MKFCSLALPTLCHSNGNWLCPPSYKLGALSFLFLVDYWCEKFSKRQCEQNLRFGISAVNFYSFLKYPRQRLSLQTNVTFNLVALTTFTIIRPTSKRGFKQEHHFQQFHFNKIPLTKYTEYTVHSAKFIELYSGFSMHENFYGH